MTPRLSIQKRIVVVEDNPSDVYLLRRALEEHGVSCSLEVVRDGEQALGYFQRMECGAEPLADLIVLDLNLPRRDGIDVLATCRQMPLCAGVPVIVLTSSDSPAERQRAEQLGVSDFVLKPIMLDEFMAVGARVKWLFDGRSASP